MGYAWNKIRSVKLDDISSQSLRGRAQRRTCILHDVVVAAVYRLLARVALRICLVALLPSPTLPILTFFLYVGAKLGSVSSWKPGKVAAVADRDQLVVTSARSRRRGSGCRRPPR